MPLVGLATDDQPGSRRRASGTGVHRGSDRPLTCLVKKGPHHMVRALPHAVRPIQERAWTFLPRRVSLATSAS